MLYVDQKYRRNETKIENPKHTFRETNLVLWLIQEWQIKSKTVTSWSPRKKRKCFFVIFISSERNFFKNLCFISMCSVLNEYAELLQNYCKLLHALFCLFFKIVENFPCLLLLYSVFLHCLLKELIVLVNKQVKN